MRREVDGATVTADLNNYYFVFRFLAFYCFDFGIEVKRGILGEDIWLKGTSYCRKQKYIELCHVTLFDLSHSAYICHCSHACN